jgi:phosphatidylserine decarboxylase
VSVRSSLAVSRAAMSSRETASGIASLCIDHLTLSPYYPYHPTMLTPYGTREWMIITLFAVVLAAVCWILLGWWSLIPVFIVWLALVSFFRDPNRTPPHDLQPDDMLSPADGTISAIETADHHEATNGPATIIRIFLSVLDVHINRVPFDGDVVDVIHRPGKYLDARTEESARVNESNLVIVRIASGETIGIKQISGAIARRIVCPLRKGDLVERGKRFGMIKFGSTTELILPRPDDVTVHVRKGEKVKGALTKLATLTGASASPAEPKTQQPVRTA